MPFKNASQLSQEPVDELSLEISINTFGQDVQLQKSSAQKKLKVEKDTYWKIDLFLSCNASIKRHFYHLDKAPKSVPVGF